MCNPAEQAGVDYANDPKKNNVLVSEMDTSIETSKAIDNHSNGSLVEINEAVVHLSSESLIEANGVGDHHSCDTSEHSAKEVLISGKDGQEVIEGVNQAREPSNTCIAMTNSVSEGNGIVKDGIQIPKSSQIEEVKFEEGALQETSKGIAGELVTLRGLSDGANGRTSIKAFEAPDSTSVSGENDLAAEKLLIDPCKGAEKPETQTDMGSADDTVEADDPLLLEGLAGGSEDHSTGPFTKTNGVMVVNNSDLSLDAKEQFLMDFNESLAWIDMRPGLSQGVAKQIAASSEEISKEDAAEHVRSSFSFKEANEETLSEIEQQDAVESSAQVQLAEFSKEDSAEHARRSFKEAIEETPSEIEQEGATVPSVPVRITDTADLKGNSPPELAEFFSSARGSKLQKEIEEQEYAPAPAKLPLKKKLFMESPRSLRMLLSSEETALLSKKDEKHKKDGKVMEFSSKVVPAEESHANDNHMEPNYPAKWYEDADNGETSSAFSGPIAYSGALTYQGLMAVPYSGSISHRSDSSTSTRSFAFPILASDWNSSPVKMGAPDPRYYRQRRKWHFCFCCSRRSTLFD